MASKIPPPPPDLPICGGITSELTTKRAAVNAAPTSTPARASAAPTGSVSDHTAGLGIGLPVGLIVGLGIGVFATMVLMQRQQRRTSAGRETSTQRRWCRNVIMTSLGTRLGVSYS